MSIFKPSPVAVFLAASVPCDKCAYPCKARENSSIANCETHMQKLINEGKVKIHIQWLDTEDNTCQT